MQDDLNSQYLSNSLSSLSHSRSTNSLVVRTYKQATQQYLTKRFKEALETLEPIVSPQRSALANGETNGEALGGPAPIAQSSRGTRTKVWVFYLSLLHSIIDLGQEQGKLVWGSAKWRELAAKARDGAIWEEVVQRGYGGNEGEVDPDVVVNLATLLHTHMPTQKLNQQRLETYLATSEGASANGNGNGHLSFAQDGVGTPMSNTSSSPKTLATRLKILELYTLHVLPANEEWDYARQFIEMNDTLDEERKEAFLNALQGLKEEKDGTAQREVELKEQREREMEQQRRKEDEARKLEEARRDEERQKAAEAEKQKAKALNGAAANPKPTVKASASASHATPSRPSKPQKRPPSPPPNFIARASSLLNNLQQMVLQASRNMTGNSMALLRFLMFMLAFLLIIGRRDLRLKIKRAMESGWIKLRQTVGMGVKVSYI